jgi:hypothetical protein
MVVGHGPKFDLLDLDHFLMLLSLVSLLVQLVKVFAVIHDPANRRLGSGRDLYEIHVFFLGQLDRIEGSQYANLIAVIVDHSYFFCPNPLDDSDVMSNTRTSCAG